MSQQIDQNGSFPQRKQQANEQESSSLSSEFINGYQKDLGEFLKCAQNLEKCLNSASISSTELVSLYNLAQIEWNKVSQNNSKLTKTTRKESSSFALFTENQKLQLELQKRDAIIQSLSSSDTSEQLKSLINENIDLKRQLENAKAANNLNSNVSAFDAFNKLLSENKKEKKEPNEELKIIKEENKALKDQIQELESEIFDINNNNPELQASLEAEKQLRKQNKELEQKIHKLEIQLRNEQGPVLNSTQKVPKRSPFDDDDIFDDIDDFDKFVKNSEAMKNSMKNDQIQLDKKIHDLNESIENDEDDFLPLKNTSDEDEEDEGERLAKNKNKNKEFELTGDMKMFSAILEPLKRKLDERCRQVEIEKMKKEGKFAPLSVSDENKQKDDHNDGGLGVDLIEENEKKPQKK